MKKYEFTQGCVKCECGKYIREGYMNKHKKGAEHWRLLAKAGKLPKTDKEKFCEEHPDKKAFYCSECLLDLKKFTRTLILADVEKIVGKIFNGQWYQMESYDCSPPCDCLNTDKRHENKEFTASEWNENIEDLLKDLKKAIKKLK